MSYPYSSLLHNIKTLNVKKISVKTHETNRKEHKRIMVTIRLNPSTQLIKGKTGYLTFIKHTVLLIKIKNFQTIFERVFLVDLAQRNLLLKHI